MGLDAASVGMREATRLCLESRTHAADASLTVLTIERRLIPGYGPAADACLGRRTVSIKELA